MDRPATEVEVSQQPDDSEPERQCSNVSDLIESHLDRLRSIGNRRFEFINLMQSDWRQFAAEREEWEKGLQATIEALKRQGYQKAADDLAAGVFSKKIVSEPGNFNIIWSTGHGLEKITTVLEGREHDDLSLAPGWGSPHVPQVGFDLLSLAELVEVDFAPRDSLPLESVWQWICCSKSGFAFCLCCPCGPIAIPSLRLGDSVPTHEILPRAFCLNPLEDGNAVKHFREVHGLDRSIKELLREYGKQVKADRLSRWDIAAHNHSLLQMRLALSREHRSLFEPGRTQHPLKTVDLQAVINSGIQAYQQGDKSWMILCPQPDCSYGFFRTNPLLRGRGIEHFRAHGLQLDNDELLQRFGYQVLGDTLADTSSTSDGENPAGPSSLATGSKCRICDKREAESDRPDRLCGVCRKSTMFKKYRSMPKSKLVRLCEERGLQNLDVSQKNNFSLAWLLSNCDADVH